ARAASCPPRRRATRSSSRPARGRGRRRGLGRAPPPLARTSARCRRAGPRHRAPPAPRPEPYPHGAAAGRTRSRFRARSRERRDPWPRRVEPPSGLVALLAQESLELANELVAVGNPGGLILFRDRVLEASDVVGEIRVALDRAPHPL